MISKSQEWARRRNWNKAQITNMIGTLTRMLNDPAMQSTERMRIKVETLPVVNALLRNWTRRNETSKEEFLRGK